MERSKSDEQGAQEPESGSAAYLVFRTSRGVFFAARDDIDLLSSTCELLLSQIAKSEAHAHRILESSGATAPINALRCVRLQRTLVAVGMFSMYEALLQDAFGWKQPFRELDTRLRA